MTPKFIRWAARHLRPVLDWRDRQKLYRAAPALRLLDAQEREARAGHKPTRPIQKQRQALMTEMLRKGQHHG